VTVRTLDRLRTGFLFPFRTLRRAILSIVVIAAVSYLGWYGVRLIRFHDSNSAAESALAVHDFPAARGHLDAALVLRPRDPETLLLAAQAARRGDAPEEAELFLARYREVAGFTDQWKLEAALQRVTRGGIEDGLDLELLLPIADTPGHPDGEQILEALAVGSETVYRYDRVGLWVGQLLKHFPKNPRGRLLLAEHEAGRGREAEAIAVCRAILADFPHIAKARYFLAELLYRAQTYEEALAEYRDLYRDHPSEFEALLGLARCLERLDRVDEARPFVRELEATHAGNSEALLECGRFAIRERRLADAERLLRAALELASRDQEVHFHLSVCLEHQGKSEEARRHLAEFKKIEADIIRLQELKVAVAKSPLDPAPRREAGEICLRNGDDPKALRWFYSVFDSHPNDRATHELLANYYQSRGDDARAAYHRDLAR
jgi:Flp pilus assembly protein TadD